MGFIRAYVERQLAEIELYLKYCNHSMKRRKLLEIRKMYKEVLNQED